MVLKSKLATTLAGSIYTEAIKTSKIYITEVIKQS